jgi:uncharacterized protein (TIGR03382 family)
MSTALLALLAHPAAARPYTQLGYAPTDVVETADAPAGVVRVHYSVEGPNQTRMADLDEDGVPDFAAHAAQVAEDALALYGALGLDPLVPESDFGLELGGSPAFDLYMVGLPSGANGSWNADECDAVGCTGFMIVDNDFPNYSPPEFGVDIVVPHEFFHGLQFAYAPDWPVWVSEGTATWAEQQYWPDNFDYIGFSNAYLENVGQPIDRPPPGPVPASAYGSALFFDFLTLRHGTDLMHELLTQVSIDIQADPDVDVMPAIDATLQAYGDSLEAAYIDFARWNLAVGSRSGGVESYPYANLLVAPTADERGTFLDTDPRYFRYGIVYLRLDHPGGPAALQWDEDHDAVHLELFPTDADNRIQPSIWSGAISTAPVDLGDLPEGTYWLLGTAATDIPQSVNARLCLGDAEAVAACNLTGEQPTDTGDPQTPAPDGCGCAAMGGVGSSAMLLAPLLGLIARRRR